MRSLVGLLLLAAGVSCAHPDRSAARSPEPPPTLTVPVGRDELDLEDAERHRPLHTLVWFPARAGATGCGSALDGIFLSRACAEAELEPGAPPLPLVLLSHGTGGGASNLVWLAESLAEHGSLVAAVDHFGDTYRNDTPEGVIAVWRRPPDLSHVLDALLADPRFGPHIAAGRIGAAGFSAGGATVLGLAGGIFRPRQIAAFCARHPHESDCELAQGIDFSRVTDFDQASRSYRDERIRAVFAMAPAMGQGFDAGSLARISIPVAIVAGVHDEIVPFRASAAHLSELIPGAELTRLDSGGHFVFMPVCNSMGLRVAPKICTDRGRRTDRATVHAEVARRALAFFAAHL
jgi:predicted dienelactone hydrolase